MHKRLLLLLTAIVLISAFWGCSKDPLTDATDRLSFSTDTLSFDTVFVTLGSTTKFFTVTNSADRPLIISEIRLEGGADSRFRINVDGTALPDGIISGVQIPPKDSIYIFVEVTVDPNGEPLPFLITDRILFGAGSRAQKVELQAYGQNAHFINGEELETQTWTDDLPYVVLGSMLVKECQTLTIEQGVEVYFGGNSGMFVAGNLIVQGAQDNIVVFRGVRLDELTDDFEYDDVPGQWRGIFLLRNDACNISSEIQFAEIRNAQFGLSLGSTTLDQFPASTLANGPSLTIENSVVRNHSVFGIYGLLSTIEARNLLVHSAGAQLLAFQMGGNYAFEHCTFYNRGSIFLDHQDELLFFSNYFADPGNALLIERDLERMNFTNCILYGSLLDEIVADTLEDNSSQFNYFFDHCLLRSRESFDGHTLNCLFNLDPLFFIPEEEDVTNFTLAGNSPCIDAGNASTGGSTDAAGNPRSDGSPDLGAFEYTP